MLKLKQGKLKVKVIEAKLMKDLDTFGKQDPYVTIRYNNASDTV